MGKFFLFALLLFSLSNELFEDNHVLTLLSSGNWSAGCVEAAYGMFNHFLTFTQLPSVISSSGKYLNDIGTYQDCVKTEKSIYLIISFDSKEYNHIQIGLCSPVECNATEYQNNQEVVAKTIDLLFQTHIFPKTIKVENVKAKNNHLFEMATGYNAVIIIMIIIGCLNAVATIIDIVFWVSPNEPNSSGFREKINLPVDTLLSFSLVRNLATQTDPNTKTDPKLGILNGTSFCALVWYVISIVFIKEMGGLYFDPNSIKDMVLNNGFFATVRNYDLGIDTLFLVSGILTSIYFYRLKEKQNENLYIQFIKAIFKRYLRVILILLMAVAIFTNVVPHFSDQAFSWQATPYIEKCQNGWYKILFLNIGTDYNDQCMNWTWFITSDLLYFILGGIIVICFVKNRLIGLVIWVVLFIGEFVLTYVVSLDKKISPSYIYGRTEAYYNFYNNPLYRINPFLLGTLLGLIYSTKDSKEEFHVGKAIRNLFQNVTARYILYLVGIAVVCLMIFSQNLVDNSKNQTLSCLAISFSGTLFTLGVTLIVFPGTLGFARFLQDILGYAFFRSMAKLTIPTIIISMIVYYSLYWATLNGQFGIYFILFKYSLSILFTGYILAFAYAVLYERPLVVLLKFVFCIVKEENEVKIEEKKEYKQIIEEKSDSILQPEKPKIQ